MARCRTAVAVGALAALVGMPGSGAMLRFANALPGARAATAHEAAKPDTPAARRTELEVRRRDVKRRVKAIQAELAASETSRAEAADALKASEQAISEHNRRLFELDRDRAAMQARLASLERERADLEQRVAGEQERLGRLLVQQYLGGRYEPFKLILSGRNPGDIARLLVYYRALREARADAVARLRDDQAQVQMLADATAREQAGLDDLAGQELTQKAALERERVAQKVTLAKVAADVRRQRQTLDKLQRDDARLAALIERLARMARALTPPPPRGATPEPPAGSTGFAARRGVLPWPVRGELASRFGTPRQGGGTTWKGWFIRCAQGTKVKAIAAGQVVFADWLRGFGNLLIIDHGDGYMSLYGYNDALLAVVGDHVRQGEPIAQAGASGGSAEPGVYFEIRHQGNAVDPAPWITGR